LNEVIRADCGAGYILVIIIGIFDQQHDVKNFYQCIGGIKILNTHIGVLNIEEEAVSVIKREVFVSKKLLNQTAKGLRQGIFHFDDMTPI
jgi:hypothetical protein